MTRAELKKIFDVKKEYLTKRGALVKGFRLISFPMFEDWFNLEVFEQGCHYCGLKNEECYRLFLLRPYATRNGKRGRGLNWTAWTRYWNMMNCIISDGAATGATMRNRIFSAKLNFVRSQQKWARLCETYWKQCPTGNQDKLPDRRVM